MKELYKGAAKMDITGSNSKTLCKYISEKYCVNETTIYNHLFSSISAAIAMDKISSQNFNELFLNDIVKFSTAYKVCSAAEHPIMHQGSLEYQLNAKQAMGIFCEAEKDYTLRTSVMKLLRTSFSAIYKSAKKGMTSQIEHKYGGLERFLNSYETRYYRCIYLYIVANGMPSSINYSIVDFIAENIIEYEHCDPIFLDIDQEVISETKKINRLKKDFNLDFDSVFNFKDLFYSKDKRIAAVAEIFEILFKINKMNIDDTLNSSKKCDINRLLLAIHKTEYTEYSINEFHSILVSTIFFQALLDEYQDSVNYYFEKADAVLPYRLQEQNIQLTSAKNTIQRLKAENESLSRQLSEVKSKTNNQLEQTINDIDKKWLKEISELNKKNAQLQSDLEKEHSYRLELNKLREYVFSLDSPYTPDKEENIILSDSVSSIKIVMIGGPKPWRRRIREKYPGIITLNGTNPSLDFRIIDNADIVLFYFQFMVHSVYNRVMNQIRKKDIKFGYLHSTNIDLFDAELANILKHNNLLGGT